MKFAAVVAVTAFAAVVTASGPAAGCLQTYIGKYRHTLDQHNAFLFTIGTTKLTCAFSQGW
jgi:hypothetical protein